MPLLPSENGGLPRARVWALVALIAAWLGCGAGDRLPPSASDPPLAVGHPARLVSLNPSLTAILVALDAGDALVGVDEFSAAQQPAVADLPRVGGLFNPSLEAVAALAPDAVLLVPSVEQRDFVARLRALGVRVEVFDNIRFDQVLENIARLGQLVGRDDQAAARIAAIRRMRSAARSITAGRPRPRTLIVLQRDPVFVVGRGSFIDELLEAAGADNPGARFDAAYPQVAVEWLIDAAPEVLIDMTEEAGDPMAYWSRWPAIPAVAQGRVLHLDPKTVTLPGPYLDRSIEALVVALHGEGARSELLAATSAGAGAGG